MRYSPALYAKAFFETKADAGRFVAAVKKNGDAVRWPQIIEEIETYATHRAGGRMVTMELARAMPATLVKKFQKNFSAKDNVRVKINPALIAGVRITLDGEQELDGSLQHKLSKLFSEKSFTVLQL